ncbi:MAG: TIGR03790 family protein [Opitutaceae bacterium]|nr:TIGR03790 family protein [Cytophagales bacterium]
MKRRILIPAMLFSLTLAAQTNYDDVAVIVNGNNAESVEIGQYFKWKRNIPDKNVIKIKCTSDLEIDSITFDGIRDQIEDSLKSKNLLNSVNYLVTVKGIPIKIKRASCYSTVNSQFERCNAFDSELRSLAAADSILRYPYSYIFNPYFGSNENFSRHKFGVFLVTRLDGITKLDVINLINNSGPDIPLRKENSIFIFDIGAKNSELSDYFFRDFSEHKTELESLGWKAEILSNKEEGNIYSNVAGFNAINYRRDSISLKWNFLPGSIGNQIDFATSDTVIQNSYKSLPFLKALSQGITGISSYPYLNFYNYSIKMKDVFERFTHDSPSFNLAEAYHSCIKLLSWMDIVIGDPKTSVKIVYPLGLKPDENEQSEIKVFPNPSRGHFFVNGTAFEIYGIKISDTSGKLLFEQNSAEINLEGLNIRGLLLLTIETNKGPLIRKISVE